MIEISRLDEDKCITLINIEIPKTVSMEEIDRYSSMYRDFLRIISRAFIEPVNELEVSRELIKLFGPWISREALRKARLVVTIN